MRILRRGVRLWSKCVCWRCCENNNILEDTKVCVHVELKSSIGQAQLGHDTYWMFIQMYFMRFYVDIV